MLLQNYFEVFWLKPRLLVIDCFGLISLQVVSNEMLLKYSGSSRSCLGREVTKTFAWTIYVFLIATLDALIKVIV